ncbi:MAG: succinate dehydrogenase [Rhabdochlamydiaceae bacterium]|nr:succinate dehydrogenase [Candidatus Amphrikana amoebophyrae]
MSTKVENISSSFVWARIHSLMGLGIVLYLIEHLTTNSMAALWVGEDGVGFIRMVNFLHGLPYLHVLEVGLIGVPLAFHAVLGIKYAIKSKLNTIGSDGKSPSMKHGRNHAFSWQRITSFILLIGIILHVIEFRFLHYPIAAKDNKQTYYLTRVDMDKGLYTLSDRLNVRLFNSDAIANEKNSLAALSSKMSLVDQKLKEMQSKEHFKTAVEFNPESASIYNSVQRFKEKTQWVNALEQRDISNFQVIAVCENFGTATLLNVRNIFRSPIMGGFYSLFVLAAVFHAFNGLWTLLLTWGVILKMGSQKTFAKICVALMVIFGFLGLAAIWGSYWINLRS